MEFVTIALGTLGMLVYKNKPDEITVESKINGKKYKVLKKGDYIATANTLATLEDKSRAFIAAAAAAYPDDPNIKRIQKYWTGGISEIPQSETIAYAIEKKELYLCVRDTQGNLQNIDDLFFVLLHELSHVMNPTYGHDDTFWKQFKKTLEMANKLGYLPYKNYDDYSVTVCGKEITSNPATCVYKGECYSELKPIRPSR
jgi:hypothetical protein